MHLSYVPGMAQGDDAGGSQVAHRKLLMQVFHRILHKVLKTLVDGPF